MIRSKTTRGFRERLDALPAEVQQKARSTYRAFLADPYQSGLVFKRVFGREETYSIRVGLHYRALGRMEDDGTLVSYWIGGHAEYDTLLTRR